MSRQPASAAEADGHLISVRIGGQLFGLPIAAVREVFVPDRITRVSLAPPEIQGILNLRGRIVTMIDMCRLLGFPPGDGRTAAGIEHRGEAYGIVIDRVGEVLRLDPAERQPNPANLDPAWSDLVVGVHWVDGELMPVLDVERTLERLQAARAA